MPSSWASRSGADGPYRGRGDDYSGAPTAEEWLAWVGKRRDVTTFKVVYLHDTDTNQVGDSLYKASISASPPPT